jgi:murein DD-endopeptidase MepM/ murein hydrolase activator NlpD
MNKSRNGFVSVFAVLIFYGTLGAQSPCLSDSFQFFNTKVRDGEITMSKVLPHLRKALQQADSCFFSHGGQKVSKEDWYFPLRGYDKRAIGGKNGSGYVPSGYGYFDGNKHGGHPAHDIFIQDKNQDGREERSGKAVDVLSVAAGIVVALDSVWLPISELRGGKYVWVYDPPHQLLFYYAHNSELRVKIGGIIKPGDILGKVGRTGKNAYRTRSPTHLHFMVLRTDAEHFMVPINVYKKLVVARLKK